MEKFENFGIILSFSSLINVTQGDWAGYALPVTNEGKLVSPQKYLEDVLKFAEKFLQTTRKNNKRINPRNLDEFAEIALDEIPLSLEEKNKRALEISFYKRAFSQVEEKQQGAGVKYIASREAVLRNEELSLVDKLGFGTLQFFDYSVAEPGPNTMSVWITAEGGGYFYVLSYKQAPISTKHFYTPTWVLQAGST